MKKSNLESDNNEPVIDWVLGTKLANNNRALAEEFLQIFIKGLPGELSAIKQAHAEHDIIKLRQHLHKLYGASCYCGVPRLKKSIAVVELAFKQNKFPEATSLFLVFEKEAAQLLALNPVRDDKPR